MAGGGGFNNTGFSAEHDTKHSFLFNTKSLLSQLGNYKIYTTNEQASQNNEHNGFKMKLN